MGLGLLNPDSILKFTTRTFESTWIGRQIV
nr:MAG TPA: hypothetical protein [Caudoviricetes sp.]